MLQNINDDRLEYVNQYCMKYFSSIDIAPETGDAEVFPSMTPEVFLKRYNNLEMNEADFRNRYKNFTIPEGKSFEEYKRSISLKGTFTYEDYKENETLQELLQDKQINLDAEKFWYLLRFIYDYTWGQCVTGMRLADKCTNQLNSFSNALSNYDILTSQKPYTLTLNIDNKPAVKIDNAYAILLLAQLWDTYKQNNDTSNLEIQLTTGTVLSESNGIMAFFSAQMFVNFFDMFSMAKKKGAKLSDKQKDLIAHFWYFTGIVSNVSALASTEYFKAIWKRYKNYKPQSINAFYV